MKQKRKTSLTLNLRKLLTGVSGNRRVRPEPAARKTAAAGVSPREVLGAALRVLMLTLKVSLAAVLLGAACVGGYLAYNQVVASTYFHISNVEISGARRAPEPAIQRLGKAVKGQNIFLVDRARLRRVIEAHPWVKAVEVQRRLPDTIHVTVIEHRAHALLLMGHLYLINADGGVFKRADQDEQEGMPVITGIDRLAYLNRPGWARQSIRRALKLLDRYYSQIRPPLSEINLGPDQRFTLYTKHGGVAVHVGQDLTADQLDRFDRVWAALGPGTERARALFLDNEAHVDRVTVRMGSYQ